jgi:hypothetical protein
MNPTIVEILSPSTERWDRGKKSKLYRSIPCLQEYIVVSQDEPHVEVYRRGEPWTYHEASGTDATIELASTCYTLRLPDLTTASSPGRKPPPEAANFGFSNLKLRYNSLYATV